MKKQVSFSNNITVFKYNKNDPIENINLTHVEKKNIGFIPILVFYVILILLVLLLLHIF